MSLYAKSPTSFQMVQTALANVQNTLAGAVVLAWDQAGATARAQAEIDEMTTVIRLAHDNPTVPPELLEHDPEGLLPGMLDTFTLEVKTRWRGAWLDLEDTKADQVVTIDSIGDLQAKRLAWLESVLPHFTPEQEVAALQRLMNAGAKTR